jgi:glycosyltransferase involved in cell wall biosynthesis
MATSGDRRSVVQRLPAWFIRLLALLARKGILPERRFFFLKAVSSRPDFLMKRLNLVDRIFVPSRNMENLLLANGLQKDKVCFSPFGLNLEFIPEKVLKSFTGRLRVGFIGSLYEHKGCHVLLEAIRALPQTVPIELHIYGDSVGNDDYRATLQRLAAQDDRIAFLGTFPNPEIGRVLEGLDVVVVPSIWYENTPLVIYSALAAGCPVIATNQSGMAEVVHDGVNGLLVEPNNRDALARALCSLIDDRDLLERLSRQTSRPRSIQEYVDDLLREYDGLRRR